MVSAPPNRQAGASAPFPACRQELQEPDRMPAPLPIFASESLAAKLLDMKQADFRRLVEQGVLPPPREIGGLKRWDIEEIRQIISGEAVDGMAGVQW